MLLNLNSFISPGYNSVQSTIGCRFITTCKQGKCSWLERDGLEERGVSQVRCVCTTAGLQFKVIGCCSDVTLCYNIAMKPVLFPALRGSVLILWPCCASAKASPAAPSPCTSESGAVWKSLLSNAQMDNVMLLFTPLLHSLLWLCVQCHPEWRKPAHSI